MKQIIFLAAVLFAGVGYSQNKPVGGDKWIAFKPEFIKQVTQVKAGPARSKDTFRFADEKNKQAKKAPKKEEWYFGPVKGGSFESDSVKFSPWTTGTNLFLYDTDSTVLESYQIHIGSKKKPLPAINPEKYTLVLNGESQTKRNGDTLTVIDKSIRFIVVDGVTYEIVRNIEIKKVETQTWPIWHPQVDTSFYRGFRLSDIPIIGRN